MALRSNRHTATRSNDVCCGYFVLVTIVSNWKNVLMFFVATVTLLQLSLFQTQYSRNRDLHLLRHKLDSELILLRRFQRFSEANNNSNLYDSLLSVIQSQNTTAKLKSEKSLSGSSTKNVQGQKLTPKSEPEKPLSISNSSSKNVQGQKLPSKSEPEKPLSISNSSSKNVQVQKLSSKSEPEKPLSISNSSSKNVQVQKLTPKLASEKSPSEISPKNSEGSKPAVNPEPSSSGLELIQSYHQKSTRHRHQFDCPAIINGEEKAIQKVRDFLRVDRPKDGYPLMKPEDAPSMFKDCDAYKKIRGYVLEEGSPEERNFPIAFVILAHQDFDHLERLVKILYRPQHVFCIHLDAKVTGALKDAVQSLASCFPNVVLASEPQSVSYASISRLLADYICMRDLVNLKRPWKYLINMAATSVPLHTNKEMVAHMKKLGGKNDITMRFQGRIPHRWEWTYALDKKGVIWSTGEKGPPPPHNITVIKGMAYNTYSREFLHWVMTDKRALDFLDWCRDTYSPDEHFWATLNDLYHNPGLRAPGGHTGHPDSYRDSTFIARFARNGQRCRGREVHRVCLFVSGDLNYLKQKDWYLTSNKFDLRYDPVAYSCMEEWLHNRTVSVS